MARNAAPASPLVGSDGLAVALTPVGVLAVHELRYRLAFGSETPARLHSTGHGYLELALPVIGLLAAMIVGRWLVRTARRYGVTSRRHRRPVAMWAYAVVSLLALYAGQELAEGALATGHASGLAAIFGDGGLWALPSAIAVGGLLALALRGASAVERAVAATRPRLLRLLPSPPRTLWPRHERVAAGVEHRQLTRSRGPPAIA